MSIGSPLGALLLLGLPLVLWLHLRRRRPRRIRVPSLTPWARLAARTLPRRRRIPPGLLLWLHLAAVAAIGLAATDPRLPGDAALARHRAVVLDASASMAAGERWDEATERARSLLDATLGERTLLVADDAPRVLVARDPDGRAARAALTGLAPSPSAGIRLDEALDLARAAAGEEAEIVLISDGGLPLPDADAPAARLEVVGEAMDNLAISRAALRIAGGRASLFARVVDFGQTPRSTALQLRADERLLESIPLDWERGGIHEAVWRLPAGTRQVELALEPADAWPEDDRRQLELRADPRRVQLVGQSDRLARAVEAIPELRLDRPGLADFRTDGSPDVSIFVGALPDRLPPGGVLVAAPEPGGALEVGAVEAGGPASSVDRVADHPLLEGLDLLGTRIGGLRDIEAPPGASILLEAGGRPAILSWNRADGRLLVLAFDPEAAGLPDRLAFPLLVARAAAWLAAPTERAEPTERHAPVTEHDLRTRVDWPRSPAASGGEVLPAGRALWPALVLLSILLVLAEAALRAGWLPSPPR